jgi:hypothetical protein
MKRSLIFLIIFLSSIVIPISGQSWSVITRLTWNAGWSMWPSITADTDNRIHVVWHDDTQGNGEIYYKSRK